MKKLCSVVAAGAMVAASIVPALAADVELGGEVRVRYQEDDGRSFTKDNFYARTTQRTRLNAKAKVDDKTTAFISLQDTRLWGSEGDVSNTAGNPADGTTTPTTQALDLSQAWIDINLGGPVSLKAGRQPLVYGKQRMLGGFEWSDNATRWDALKLTVKTEPVDVDVIKATWVEQGANNSDKALSGFYATVNVIPTSKLDVYYLIVDDQASVNWNAAGVRIAGNAAGADWDVEYIMESGDYSKTSDLDASALVASAGYTIAPAANLRVGLEYANGSGEESGADTEAFQTIAATNHPLYGLHDTIVGPAAGVGGRGNEGQRLNNLNATGVNVTLPNLGGVKLRAEVWQFTLNETVAGQDDEYGQEINLQAWYGLTEKTKLHAYYVQFEPGDGISAAPNDETATTLVVQLHTKF